MRLAWRLRCTCLHFPATCGDDSVVLGWRPCCRRAAGERDRLCAGALPRREASCGNLPRSRSDPPRCLVAPVLPTRTAITASNTRADCMHLRPDATPLELASRARGVVHRPLVPTYTLYA